MKLGRKRINADSYLFEEEIYKMYLQGELTNYKPKDIMLKVLQQELTEIQLSLVEMYYFQHMNMVQIAEVLGKDTSTISRTLKRARQRIKRFMKYFV
jgi:RNA polymerase sigma factor (sigma-70 family)